jgi:hypothetical protein
VLPYLEVRGHEDSISVAATGDENQKPTEGVTFEPPFWDLRRRRRKRFIATHPPSKYVDSIQAFDVSKCIFSCQSDMSQVTSVLLITYLSARSQLSHPNSKCQN